MRRPSENLSRRENTDAYLAQSNMSQKMVLVTGSTGFLGRHLVATLRDRGYFVVANARNRVTGVEADRWVLGDLREAATQEAAVQGCTLVVNAAGLVKKSVPDAQQDYAMTQMNCVMAESLARTAERSGVRRFLQISSTGVYGSQSSRICDERIECLPEDAYEKSKWAGEQHLLVLENRSMQIVIARPSNIFGEWHSWNKLLTWMKAVRSGKVVLAGNPEKTHVNYVYVGDVTGAVTGLLECPEIADGEIFNINTPATMAAFHQATATAVGRPNARRTVVPTPLLLAAAVAFETAGRFLGRTPPLNREKVAELAGTRIFPSERLVAMCPEFPPVGLNEGLVRLAAHYHNRGLL